MGVSLQPLALAKQQELREAGLANRTGKLAPRAIERRRIAIHQLRGPFEVIRAGELRFQRPEQRIVIQPVRMVRPGNPDTRPANPRALRQ